MDKIKQFQVFHPFPFILLRWQWMPVGLHMSWHWRVRQLLHWHPGRQLHLLVSFSLHGMPCPCARVHYGLWLFRAARVDSVHTVHSYVHSPLRDNKNSCGLSSGMQKTQNCQIPASLDWPSHCLCFAAVPKCSWGLLRTQVSPRNGKGLPCSWNPPNKAELSIILNQGFVTAKQGL